MEDRVRGTVLRGVARRGRGRGACPGVGMLKGGWGRPPARGHAMYTSTGRPAPALAVHPARDPAKSAGEAVVLHGESSASPAAPMAQNSSQPSSGQPQEAGQTLRDQTKLPRRGSRCVSAGHMSLLELWDPGRQRGLRDRRGLVAGNCQCLLRTDGSVVAACAMG